MIQRISGANCFWVSYAPDFSVIHYGYNEDTQTTDTGQPIFVAMNFNGWKQFLITHGVWDTIEEADKQYYETRVFDPVLPTPVVIQP